MRTNTHPEDYEHNYNPDAAAKALVISAQFDNLAARYTEATGIPVIKPFFIKDVKEAIVKLREEMELLDISGWLDEWQDRVTAQQADAHEQMQAQQDLRNQ